MYSFHVIRNAVLAATPRPAELPFGEALPPERLRQLRGAPHLQVFLGELRDAAERAAATPIPALPFSLFRTFETDGTRPPFQRPYFDRRGRLLALALTSWLDETDDYLPALHDLLWAICDEYAWSVPAHLPVGVVAAREHRVPPDQVVDLFAAETAHALSETVTLLGDRLDPWLAYRVRNEIERRVFRPLFHDPVRFGWESATHNWAAVCAGAVGMAALLLEEDRERLAGMLDRVVRALEGFLDGYGEDGGCAEGMGYWSYGFGYYVFFAELLRTWTGDRLDLLRGEKIARIAAFPMGVSLGDGNVVGFSDGAARGRVGTGLGSRLAARLGQPMPEMNAVPPFGGDQNYRWPQAARNLVWTDPRYLHAPTPEGTVSFPDLAWVVDRHRVGGRMVAFAAKGGHNAEPHNHNDLGHFILHVGGENLLADLGAALYTRAYFGPDRYQSLHAGSEGHSVPVIDGEPQRAGREHAAVVVRSELDARPLVFELDLTRAYDAPDLLGFSRAFRWERPSAGRGGALELVDAFRFRAKPRSLDEVFISLHEPSLGEGTATWRGSHGAVTLRYDAAQFRASVEALPSQDHHERPSTVHRLRLRHADPGEEVACRFAFACDVATGEVRGMGGQAAGG